MDNVPISASSKCETCKLSRETWFCNLPQEVLVELERVKQTRIFSRGERLFEQGKPANELMIVCQGAAALSFSSANGTTLALGFSEPGEVLGLSAAVSACAHQTSAEAVQSTQVAVIPRADFLRLLQRFTPVAINTATALSRKVSRAYEKIRLIGSGFSVPQRLAAWLLDLQRKCQDEQASIKVSLTHEQIAQLLGASRESITRALSHFRRLGVVEVRGIHFYMRDRNYLRSLLQHAE